MSRQLANFGWDKHGIFIRTEKDSGFVELELYDQKSGRTIETRRLQPGIANSLGFVLEVAAIIAKPAPKVGARNDKQ